MSNIRPYPAKAILIVTIITSVLIGVFAGGGIVYFTVVNKITDIEAASPRKIANEAPFYTKSDTIRTVEIQSAVTEAVGKVGPAVVTVINHLESRGGNPFFRQMEPRLKASGSGVFISEKGYVVTNNHVVAGNRTLDVILRDGRTLTARLVGTDEFADLAVLKVDESAPAWAEFGNSDALKPGETAIAIGSPLGEFQNTVTVGVVSATGRSLPTGEAYQMEDLVQTDAAINSGNSGGPLVNSAGQIIGINTLVVRGGSSPGDVAEGIGFAIASNAVKAISNQLIQQGSVARPFLGIQYQLITPDLARMYRLPVKWGVYITDASRNNPAARAGLEPGDIITGIDGEDIDENSHFINLLFRQEPGKDVQITFIRDGRKRTTEVRLEMQ
jgi:serine protease Do